MGKLDRFLHFSLSFLFLVSCSQHNIPPKAKIVPKSDTLFNDIRVDNYFWLRERDNPAVLEYLKQENRYTERIMRDTKKMQEQLYQEMVARIQEDDSEVPVKIDDYFYYSRTEKGKQYKIYCRKKGDLAVREEILLDLNQLAQGKEFINLGIYRVSPDHQLLAYSIDTTGAESYMVFFKDLKAGRRLADKISNTSYSFEWAQDNKTVFYDVLDEIKRPYKAMRHVLGTSGTEDIAVYTEPDKAFELSISKTKDKHYILLTMTSMTTSEVRFLDATSPMGVLSLIQPRQHEMEYYAESHGDDFFIRTNDKAVNFKMIRAPIRQPGKSTWKPVLPYFENVMIQEFDMFQNHLVLYERENGLKIIHIINLVNSKEHWVQFPEPVIAKRILFFIIYTLNEKMFKIILKLFV